ncbi:MAG: hypothetical protein IPK15_01825 [Verrucomicrobia bacterium]|nr:hypothetical protein [Verrucomicrobiota bacterium]
MRRSTCLLSGFKDLLANERHCNPTIKRGGRITFVPVNDTPSETRFLDEPVDDATPERHFDYAWEMTLWARVAGDLKAEYERPQKK